MVAPRPDKPPAVDVAGLAVAGDLSGATGLGELARLMLRGVELLGLPAWPLDVGAPIGRRNPELAAPSGPPPPRGVPLAVHVNAPTLPLALIRLGRKVLRARRIIGCWSWELPTVPPDWRISLPFVHEVWVPSNFTAAAIEPLLPGRVHVVRPPLAEVPPLPSRLARADFGLPENCVIVLVAFNLASSFVRKNPLAAITAFRTAFADRGDRLLLLKVGNPHHFPEDFKLLQAAVAELPNVRVETRILPPADNYALMAAVDVVLSLHRSEGLGLVLAEAMFLRKPVVCTGWSGNMDFMDDESAALVPVRLIPPADPRNVLEAEGAVWAEPDIGVAAQHLRRLADAASDRAALGERAHAMAEARFGLDTLADALRGIGQNVDQTSRRHIA
jgi:glycosyltransferase involved in cell wall biosynthesis